MAIYQYNTKLQLVSVDIKSIKQITIANICIAPRDNTSTQLSTINTDITNRMRHITNIANSLIASDINAHSTLWHSYTDDHREQIIADIISTSDRITLNTDTR